MSFITSRNLVLMLWRCPTIHAHFSVGPLGFALDSLLWRDPLSNWLKSHQAEEIAVRSPQFVQAPHLQHLHLHGSHVVNLWKSHDSLRLPPAPLRIDIRSPSRSRQIFKKFSLYHISWWFKICMARGNQHLLGGDNKDGNNNNHQLTYQTKTEWHWRCDRWMVLQRDLRLLLLRTVNLHSFQQL